MSSWERRQRWISVSYLGLLLHLFSQPLAACSVCFGDPEKSSPVQAAILLLLALVVLVQVVVARLLWRLLRRPR